MCPRVGTDPTEIQGPLPWWVSRSTVVQGTSRHLCQCEGYVAAAGRSHHPNRRHMPSGPQDVGGNTVITEWANLPSDLRSCCWVESRTGDGPRPLCSCSLTWLLWLSRSRGAGSGRQGCRLEPLAALSSELEYVGFWSKSLPPSEDNCSPSEKELLLCYLAWAFNFGPPSYTPPEMPIYLVHQTVQLGAHSNTPPSNGNSKHKTGLSRRWRYHAMWRSGPNAHGPLSCYAAFSPPVCIYGWPHRETLPWLREGQKTQAWFTNSSAWCAKVSANPPGGQNAEQYT